MSLACHKDIEGEQRYGSTWHWIEKSGRLHALAALPLGKELPLHTDKESGWAPRLVCMFCRRK